MRLGNILRRNPTSKYFPDKNFIARKIFGRFFFAKVFVKHEINMYNHCKKEGGNFAGDNKKNV